MFSQSVPKSKHKVYIYSNDYQSLCNEVFKHQNIETGGNLFGLWTTSGSAVIHVLLGPGKHCRRTSTSFHQDIEYMQRVGSFVNTKFMLCHIGEWHSHHRLSLNKPSSGDEQTVQRNFPQGISKFLVIIANIRGRNHDTIELSPYFFSDGGNCYEIAERVVLEENSPFSTDPSILSEIENGAESLKGYLRSNSSEGRPYLRKNSTEHNGYQRSQSNEERRHQRVNSSEEMQNKRSKPLRELAKPFSPSSQRDTSSISRSTSQQDDNSSPTLTNQRSSHSFPTTPTSQTNDSLISSQHGLSNTQDNTKDGEEPMDTADEDLHPPHDYDGAGSVSPSDKPHPNKGTVNITPLSHISPSNPAEPQQSGNDDETTLTTTEIGLKKIHDALKYWFGRQPDSKFEFQRFEDAIEITFKHNETFWLIRFPPDYPTKPARLFSSYWETGLRNAQCFYNIVKPLNNDVNILLSISKKCGRHCVICKRFTRESLSQNLLPSKPMEKLVDSVQKFVPQIESTFQVTGSINAKSVSISGVNITFKHDVRYWVIELPAEFPEEPAKVYYQSFEGSSQKIDVFLHSPLGLQALITLELIIKAIQFNCVCTKCIAQRR